MNESEDCTGIPWADSKQYMFWRRCQQCLACITAEAANQRETWQWCVYHSSSVECPGELPTPSSYAVVAERLLRATIRENYLVTQWRVVRGWPGGVDFSMPVRAVGGELRWVHVEVDGETHTTKGWEASTAQQQQARDREKDALAWEQGLMLVRLHHRDLLAWSRFLRAAAFLAARPCRGRFIFYTPAYAQLQLESRSGLMPRCAHSPSMACHPIRCWCAGSQRRPCPRSHSPPG